MDKTWFFAMLAERADAFFLEPAMALERVARLLERLSSRGLRFYDARTKPRAVLPPGRFARPFYPPQAHGNHIEMILLLEGRLALHVNGAWTPLEEEKPTVFLRGAYHTEHALAPRQPYTLQWLSFLPDALTLHQTAYGPGAGYSQSAMRVSLASPLVGKLWDCGRAADVDRPRFHYLLMQCLDDSLKRPRADAQAYHAQVLDQVRKYIDDYFAEKVALRDLAAMAHYTPGHLNALFARRFGVTVVAYLNRVRLAEARRLLAADAMPVKRIAYAVGFSDPLYFSRYFKKITGLAPRDFALRARSRGGKRRGAPAAEASAETAE